MATSSGKPVQIAGVDEQTDDFWLDEQALISILMQDEVRNKPVVVVSVAGAFRTGKSLLMSQLLRFVESGGVGDWLGAEDQPLTGFTWRSGVKPETKGINMWSRPLKMRLASGEQVVVLLVDTEGSFDNRSTVRQNAVVFALNALTSSVLIYNVMKNVGSDVLQHLQQFAEYGRLVAENDGFAPFQKLLFLVRDWQFIHEASYGLDGGRKFLAHVLEPTSDTPREIKDTRRQIRQSFSSVDAFLMPHPGMKVATSPQFQGYARDIEPDFLRSLDALAKYIFSPENLLVKQISGRTVTAGDLVTYFKTYHQLLESGDLPTPSTLLQTTAGAEHLAAVSKSQALFAEEMKKVCCETSPTLTEGEFQVQCHRAQEMALTMFKSRPRMEGADMKQYEEKLLRGIDEWKEQFCKLNDTKRRLKAADDERICLRASKECYDFYRSAMTRSYGPQSPAVDSQRLREAHDEQQQRVLATFDNKTNSLPSDLVLGYRQILTKNMDGTFEEFFTFNTIKSRSADDERQAQEDMQSLNAARERYREIMNECRRRGPMEEQQLLDQQRHAQQESRRVLNNGVSPTNPNRSKFTHLLDQGLEREGEIGRRENLLDVIVKTLTPVIQVCVHWAASKCVIM